jgi:hypothetical protein
MRNPEKRKGDFAPSPFGRGLGGGLGTQQLDVSIFLLVSTLRALSPGPSPKGEGDKNLASSRKSLISADTFRASSTLCTDNQSESPGN